MSNKQFRKRALELSILGAAAGLAVACSDRIVDAAGDMTADAGEVLMDAGTMLADSGMAMLDAGGHLLSDAGHALHDAGHAMRDAGHELQDGSHEMTRDAKAQEACAVCSASGAQKAVQASDDPEQWVGGNLRTAAWTYGQGTSAQGTYGWLRLFDIAGPLVITDVVRHNSDQGVYILPAGTTCHEVKSIQGPPYLQVAMPDSAAALFHNNEGLAMHGGRVLVRADEHLCITNGSGYGVGNPALPNDVPYPLQLSAYRPYE
ncbi:MAG: hypothetical protein QM778_18990 [Myxococcales bacterium]